MNRFQELNTQIEMSELIDKLNEATEKYDEGHPIMSDKEWDKLYFRLVELETLTGVVLPNSPTHEIHFVTKDKLEKVTHDHPMLSLPKTQDVNEVSEFVKGYDYISMAKMDGLTCSLTYENGELVRAETRGNGTIGEDVTHNALVIPSIPNYINYKNKLVIDGEIICTIDIFNKYFAQDYKNARNFASGSIRLLNSYESRSRLLTFVAWDVITPIEGVALDWIAQIHAIQDFGFSVVFGVRGNDGTPEDIQNHINLIKAEAQVDHFPIDGIVFKYSDLRLRDSLGATSHHFNNAIAFKFEDEKYDTELLNIEWTMGRTGVLTPIAVFKPVDADGSIIERASLHNFSIMQGLLGLNPWVGQKLLVEKANMIIPQVVWAEVPLNTSKENEIPMIDKCPICGHPIKMVTSDSSTVNIYCSNSNCEGKFINQLEHFVGKSGLDIKGISKATLEKLINWEWVKKLSDIFELSQYRNEWIMKSGFGEKSVDNILNAIESSKNISLDKFICAIGIPLIGRTASKDLMKKCKTYEEFRNMIKNNYDFSLLPNFGYEMYSSIIKFNYNEADYIAEKYLSFSAVKEETSNNLNNMTIVITGKLTHFKNRAELQSIIENAGGKVSSSISKNTKILINNDINSNSSKNQSAKKLNIPIISENDFIEQYLKN